MSNKLVEFPKDYVRNMNMATSIKLQSRLDPNMQVSYIHGSIIYSSSDLGTKEKIISDGIEITPNSTNANRATIKFPVCDNFKLAHGTKVPEDIRAIKNIYNVLKSSIDIDDMTLNQVHEFHPYTEILDDEIVDTMDKNGIEAIYTTSKTHRFSTAQYGDIKPTSPVKLLQQRMHTHNINDINISRFKGVLVADSTFGIYGNNVRSWPAFLNKSEHSLLMQGFINNKWWNDQIVPHMLNVGDGLQTCFLTLKHAQVPINLSRW